MRCKLDRDLVKRESTLLPRNLPSRLLSRISQVSRIVSQRLRCPLLVTCSPQQRSNWNRSLAYSPIRIVTILWRYCDVPSARFFVDLLLLLFLFNLDIERRWNARRCFNNVFFFSFFFFQLEVYKEGERRASLWYVKEKWRSHARTSREKEKRRESGKKFSNERCGSGSSLQWESYGTTLRAVSCSRRGTTIGAIKFSM